MSASRLVLALAAAALAASPAKDEPWSSERFSPEEIRVDRELSVIEKRIASGALPKVEFDLDSDRIRPESYPVLDLIADLLLKNPRVKVRIAAHTCILGSQEYNLALSSRRARSVMAYLVRQGVPPPSLRYRGWGASQPVADNATEEGRRRNRRVEFRVMRGDWGSVY